MSLGHTSRECKGHPMHITTPTRTHPYLLGDPLLIIPSLHLLLGPLHLDIIPSQPTNHFNHMLHHNLSGMHHPRGGGPNTTMFQLYCLHHLPNHKFYTLLHLNNLRCLPNQIQTRTIDKHNKYTVERDIISSLCCGDSGNQPEIWESTPRQPTSNSTQGG